ncbi:ligand-binding sensor domain-containing protein, partial [Bacteroides ovatus]
NIRYDVRSLLLEGDNLWVGTYAEGLHVLNLKTGNIKSYTYSRNIPNTLCSNDVLSLFKDRKGEIFIGTSWGLCRYNPQSDNFITVINVGAMASVTDIYEDMYNNLWIATSNRGVFCYNTVGEEWKHFEHIREDLTTITSNSVITLFEDRKGTMWFGTNGGGLCSFSKETETFVDFDPENVWLPDKVIYSIEQDQAGNFWISCNSGLYQFNPTDKNKNRLFTINDGLQGNQFTAQSSLASSTGKLYFGGVNGFNVFEPKEFADNTYLP